MGRSRLCAGRRVPFVTQTATNEKAQMGQVHKRARPICVTTEAGPFVKRDTPISGPFIKRDRVTNGT